MFQAIEEINIQDSKGKLLIDGKHCQTSNKGASSKNRNILLQGPVHEDAEKIHEVQQQQIKIPFTPLEVTNALKKLKYSKSPGMDNIRAEHLKMDKLKD